MFAGLLLHYHPMIFVNLRLMQNALEDLRNIVKLTILYTPGVQVRSK